MVPLSWYLFLSMVLFTLGLIGVLMRRNMIIILMCIELMLNAVNLSLVAFSRFQPESLAGVSYSPDPASGQLMVFFVMAVAAAEVAVGLAIIVALFRVKHTVLVDRMNLMRD
jgi:NADH-quinone oxidoreductase subunit K